MTVISNLPFTLTNGAVADASQVMANFNQIVNDVNNAASSGTLAAYRGAAITKSTFQVFSSGDTTVTFNTTIVDTNTIKSGNTLVVPTSITKVRIVVYIACSEPGSSAGSIYVNKTGSSSIWGALAADINVVNETVISWVSPIVLCNAGDVFSFHVVVNTFMGT